MPRSKASNEAQYRYNAAHLKRVPLDLQISEYEELKQAATAAGMSVNGFIKHTLRAAGAISDRSAAAVPEGGKAGGAAGRGNPTE